MIQPTTRENLLYGVSTDYDLNAGRKRDHITVWSGPFLSTFEAAGISLPRGNGYMLTTNAGEKVRVECSVPRTDDNFQEVDRAITDALAAHRKIGA